MHLYTLIFAKRQLVICPAKLQHTHSMTLVSRPEHQDPHTGPAKVAAGQLAIFVHLCKFIQALKRLWGATRTKCCEKSPLLQAPAPAFSVLPQAELRTSPLTLCCHRTHVVRAHAWMLHGCYMAML